MLQPLLQHVKFETLVKASTDACIDCVVSGLDSQMLCHWWSSRCTRQRWDLVKSDELDSICRETVVSAKCRENYVPSVQRLKPKEPFGTQGFCSLKPKECELWKISKPADLQNYLAIRSFNVHRMEPKLSINYEYPTILECGHFAQHTQFYIEYLL